MKKEKLILHVVKKIKKIPSKKNIGGFMKMEAYFPNNLSNRIKVKEEKFVDLIMNIKLELGRLDGAIKHNFLKTIVKAFLRAEETLASASLEFSELSFEEYIEKLLDKGYGADDLNEIRFMVDYYEEFSKRVQERGFSIDSLNNFQQALLNNRRKRTVTREQLLRRRQPWLYEAIIKQKKYDMRLYAYPDEEKINSLMENLNNFINNNRMDPLITVAITYGQLAMIHPWRYANGRTTGALIPFLFNQLGLTRERSFYLSSAFCKNKKEYFSKLVNLFQKGKWDEWVQYFLEKVYNQVISGQKKIDHLMDYCRYVKAQQLKNSFSRQTLFCADKMLSHPVFTIGKIEKNFGFNKSTVLIYVNYLLEAGILIKDNRKRNVNFIFKEVFEIMDF